MWGQAENREGGRMKGTPQPGAVSTFRIGCSEKTLKVIAYFGGCDNGLVVKGDCACLKKADNMP
jgi:hypothetical protein